MTPQSIIGDIQVAGSIESRLFKTRQLSLELAEPLSAEDMTVQAMDDASPTKWHLAHTSPGSSRPSSSPSTCPAIETFDESFNYCFNSYYESQGPRQPRPRRGLLTRPSSRARLAYRAHVDEAWRSSSPSAIRNLAEIARLIEVGINHEQQHQELLLTDILALFAANPLRPAYRQRPQAQRAARRAPSRSRWLEFAGGIRQVGHDGKRLRLGQRGAAPRRASSIPSASPTGSSPTANGSHFMADGGYRNAALWLADGWAHRQPRGLAGAALLGGARRRSGSQMSLAGPAAGRSAQRRSPMSATTRPTLSRAGPASGSRPNSNGRSRRRACRGTATRSAPARCGRCRPTACARTASRARCSATSGNGRRAPICPIRAIGPPAGALGEYNGKFMVSQQVLRGGSCATPDGHTRATYRNFFYPHQRWQFMGLRLASEID